MALSDQAALAADVGFQNAVRIGSVEEARTYIDAGSNTTEKYARYSLARAVLEDGCNARLPALTWAVASINTITILNYNTSIMGALPSVFNQLSGLAGNTA